MADVGAVGLRLRRTGDAVVICDQLSMGESFSQRLLGLMGRASIGSDEGLYLQTSSIHMMFMRFPIDALFLGKPDGDGKRRVVATREHLPPWRGIVMPVRGAEGVVELQAGTLGRHGVGLEDRVIFESAEGRADTGDRGA
ncbi:MAG: DUF192 domain-containing protein [Chloroflexota bacterium]